MHVLGTFQFPPHHTLRGARRVCKLLASRQGLVVLGLLGMTLGMLGCDGGSVGGSSQCGGSNDSDACVRVVTVEPTYLDQTSSNVDVVQVTCPDNTPEPFTDHAATVTLSNAPLPGVGPSADTSVTLRDFSVRYSLNACPPGATCPALDTLTVAPGQTVTIPPNSSATVTLPLVSLAKKFEYVSNAGSLSAYPSYTATYTITGTDSFHNSVSAQGSAQFTIGAFDNCTR